MIKVVAKVSGPLDRVIGCLRRFDTWQEWMPQVVQCRLLEEDEKHAVVELHSTVGMSMKQLLEFDLAGQHAFRFKQRSGRLNRFEGEWRFLTPPDGAGTTIAASVEIDAGFFVPQAMVHSSYTTYFRKVMAAVEKRLGPAAAPAPAAPAARRRVRRLFRIVRTSAGLVIQSRGQTIPLSAASLREILDRLGVSA